VGHDIVAPDGNRYYPLGANVGAPLAFDWRGIADGHAADAVAWGWNTVRLTLVCTNIAPWDYVSNYGYPALLAEVGSIIKEYTAQKIVVMVECHDLSMEQGGTGDLNDPFIPQLDRFWTDMAKTYKNNPYVWFDANNEPPNDNVWVPLHRHFLNLVRAQGAENIYVADGPQAGEDAGWGGGPIMSDAQMGPALVAGQCNVLLSVHNYGARGDVPSWTAYINGIHAQNLAIVGGEFGYTIDGSSTAGGYQFNLDGANAQFAASPGLGVGMLWWHGTHGDNYSLKASGDAFYADGGPGANLSPAGQRLWNVAHAKPSLGRFTGDLRQSNCPSAG
jgi:mannan endo-1,4-beta-mannosidase